MGYMPKNRPEKKPRTGLLVVLLLLLLALLAAAAIYIWKTAQPTYSDRLEPNAVAGSMPGKTREQIEQELYQKVKDTEIAFSINAAPLFETGDAKGNILFENPSNNDKLTRVEITRDDTGELLYKSGLLEPGNYVPEAHLEVDLEPGIYSCTAMIYAYRLSDETFLGQVAAGLKLTVVN